MTDTHDDIASMDIAVDLEDARAYELARMRHSAAHLMAEAVLEIFPDARLGIGPAIEHGFYYDFDLPRPLTPDDLVDIERRMEANREKAEPFVREVVTREEALRIFADNPYKVELIEGLPQDEIITTYQQGEFLDLCRGPHVPSTAEIGPFKLLSIAGAYWRGDEKRPMLQRIYGTAWPTQDELDAHLTRLEEAQRRDHRRLGRELDLFSVNEEIGPGLILWHPKGAMIRYLVEQFEQKEQLARGYDLVYTPHIASEKIYRTSGHLETYRENMYSPMSIEEVDYYLKPMNCPGHIMIYKNRVHSYRDLPIRLAELGTVYRYERSGHAARHAARARLYAGRRPHLLHAGAGRRRGRRGDRPGHAHGRRLRLRVPVVSGDAPGEVDRRRPRSGRRRSRICGARWRYAVCRTRSTRVAGRSTVPRSTSSGSMRSAGSGRVPRSRSISICRSDSTSITSARTASGTGSP